MTSYKGRGRNLLVEGIIMASLLLFVAFTLCMYVVELQAAGKYFVCSIFVEKIVHKFMFMHSAEYNWEQAHL